MKRTSRLERFLLLGAFAVACGACVPVPKRTTYRTGEALPPSAVETIGPGTPVREVLERLGPPAAVARAGTVAQLPLYPGRKEGSRAVAADALFSRFAGARPQGPRDVVFVYEASRLDRSKYYATLVGIRGPLGDVHLATRDRLATDRLLLLVDGERRVVIEKVLERETRAERPRPGRAGGASDPTRTAPRDGGAP